MTVNSLGTNVIQVQTAGEIKYPLQCAFNAYLSANVNNVTGTGTSYTILWDSERFDQNNDFDTSTGRFVAPDSGKYFLSSGVQLTGSTNKYVVYIFIYNNTTSQNLLVAIQTLASSVTTDTGVNISGIVELTAGDSISTKVQAFGSTSDDADISSSAGQTFLCGYLVC